MTSHGWKNVWRVNRYWRKMDPVLLATYSVFERQAEETELPGYGRTEDIGDEEEIIRKKSKKLHRN